MTDGQHAMAVGTDGKIQHNLRCSTGHVVLSSSFLRRSSILVPYGAFNQESASLGRAIAMNVRVFTHAKRPEAAPANRFLTRAEHARLHATRRPCIALAICTLCGCSSRGIIATLANESDKSARQKLLRQCMALALLESFIASPDYYLSKFSPEAMINHIKQGARPA